MIEEFLSEDERVADTRIKPALLTLLVDQASLIDSQYGDEFPHDIRSGFPEVRSLIEWYQRAAVRTVGCIADEWDPADCVNDRTLLSAVVHPRGLEIDPMETEAARNYRIVLEASVVQPACNRGYKKLRKAATEYVYSQNEEERISKKDLDPRQQANIAMRPGFQTLDNQQQRALDRLWGGFESEDGLLDWLHGLNSPTNGEIDARSEDVPFTESVVTDPVALTHLVREKNTRKSRKYRIAFAASEILPAFVDGVRSIETGELAKASQGTPTTFRMK